MNYINNQDSNDEDELSNENEEYEDQDNILDNNNSEDEEEDNNDDDEDYDDNQKRRKNQFSQNLKKKVKGNQEFSARNFYELQAEEDSEEEESIGGDEEFIDNKQVKKDKEIILRMEKEHLINQPRRQTPAFLTMQPKEAEEYFENKYQYQEEYDENQLRNKEISYLPSINDPKMFAVRCKPGSESEIVMILMNKYIFFRRERQELLLYSVYFDILLYFLKCSYLPKFKGYVYIEAEKMAFVIEAISDLKDIYKHNSIQIIPVHEVPQLFVPEKQAQLQLQQWIRIKHGLYENDLAQIISIEENRKYYTVRLIPRLKINIEEEKEQQKEGKMKTNFHRKSKMRPEKKLFKSNEHIGVERKTYDKVEEIWKNQLFISGYLHKRFNANNIDHEEIVPTIEEVEAFLAGEQTEEDKYKVWDSMQKQVQSMKNQIHNFQKGDRVIVIRGEQKHLAGVVVEAQKDQIYVQRDGFKNQLIFQPMELRKDFKLGQHITILDGVYKNYNGTITNIQDMIAKIILDHQNKEVKILVNDLKLWNSSLITSNVNKFTLLKLHQSNTVQLLTIQQRLFSRCIVLQSFKDALRVIDNTGQISTIQYYQIDKELNDQRSSVRNRQKQLITLNANVKIMEGLRKGKTAIVTHLYGETLFLYNQEFSQTFGIFVENANNCIVITESYNQQRGKVGVKKDPLIGKLLTVCRGAWKGYQGTVKEADSKSVRIELSCRCKIITISRIEATGDNEAAIEENEKGLVSAMQTPAYKPEGGGGDFTPGHPGMFGMSPAWETPVYEPNKRY